MDRCVYWKCKCDCGVIKDISSRSLASGLVISCGCYHKEVVSKQSTKHNMCKTRFYSIYQNMNYRTKFESPLNLKNYISRGITVCERWLDFNNFKADMYESYLSHVAEYGEMNTSIERKDNDAGYSPGNCRWATKTEQNFNKRSTRRYEINGELLTITQISIKYNIAITTLHYRIKNGWSMENILTQPIKITRGELCGIN